MTVRVWWPALLQRGPDDRVDETEEVASLENNSSDRCQGVQRDQPVKVMLLASTILNNFFSHDKYSTNTINEKSKDGVLGTLTRGGRMVGADESTPNVNKSLFILASVQSFKNELISG